MIVGERLQELRKDKGLSQKELAAILGIKPKTLSAYEREVANPSDEIKVKIAKYFNISLRLSDGPYPNRDASRQKGLHSAPGKRAG